MTKKLCDELTDWQSDVLTNLRDIQNRATAAAIEAGRDPKDITLLAATKTVDVQRINFVLDHGVALMGENRVQEFLSKEEFLQADVSRIHFIGGLQTNKVKYLIGKVSCIHSVDRLSLAQEIDRLGKKKGIVTNILIEVNIGRESGKSGVDPDKTEDLIRSVASLSGISVKGLMAIPPICEKNDEISDFFARMEQLFIDIRGKKIDNVSMDILSMGMSGDFEQAIHHGATIIRIGTALFGKRV